MAALSLLDQLQAESDRQGADIRSLDRYVRTHNAAALAALNRRMTQRASRIRYLLAAIDAAGKEEIEEEEPDELIDAIECPNCGPVPVTRIRWDARHLADEPRWFGYCSCGHVFKPE